MISSTYTVKYDGIDNNLIDENISIALDVIGMLLEKDARTQHRYKSITGNLTQATKYSKTQKAVKLFIDDIQAKYGKYVHQGHGTWLSDPFITDAISRNQSLITQILENATSKSIVRS